MRDAAGDQKKKFEEAQKLLRDNLQELKKEWKVHLMPDAESMVPLFRELIRNEAVAESVYQAKILFDLEKAKSGSPQEVLEGTKNFPVIVLYVYGSKTELNPVLREVKEVVSRLDSQSLCAKPRFSVSYEKDKLIYFTQGSGDIKILYEELREAANISQLESLFIRDLSRFNQTAVGASCGACASPIPLFLCGRCESAAYCGVRCQKDDWARHQQTCFK